MVTIEGDDPGRAFGQMMSADDAFSTWFGERARDFYGDVPAPTTEAPSELVLDTDGVAGQNK